MKCRWLWLIAVLLAGPAFAKCDLTKVSDLKIAQEGNQITIPGKINGQPVKFLFQIAATHNMVLAPAANALGLRVVEIGKHFKRDEIVNKMSIGQATIDEMEVDRFVFKSTPVLVRGQRENYGQPQLVAVLGNDFLGQYDIEIDLKANRVTLYKTQGCEAANLAYWSDSYNVAELEKGTRQVVMNAKVNGQDVRAILDSGSPFTTLTYQAAVKIGAAANLEFVDDRPVASDAVTLNRASAHYPANIFVNGAEPDLDAIGSGDIWIRQFDSFTLDQETIKPARIRVRRFPEITAMTGSRIVERSAPTEEMLLGVDFLRSHHVLISRSQNKFYFTFNGEQKPFQTAAARE